MAEPLKQVGCTSLKMLSPFDGRINNTERSLVQGVKDAVYPHTPSVYYAMIALLGSTMVSPLTPATPEDTYDHWELCANGDMPRKPTHFSIHSGQDGKVHFFNGGYEQSIFDDAFANAMGVRVALSRGLRFSPKSLYSDLSSTVIEGPTKDQPFVVVHSRSNQPVVQQNVEGEQNNIEGLAFIPYDVLANQGVVELWGTQSFT